MLTPWDLFLTALATGAAALVGGFVGAYINERARGAAQRRDIQDLTRLLEATKAEFVEGNARAAEKGKNSATKEDIAEITRTVETVKTDFVREVEALKAQLGRRNALHTLAAEQELKAMIDTWDAITPLRRALLFLTMYQQDPSITDEAPRYGMSKDLDKEWKNAGVGIINAVDQNDLFLPTEIRTLLNELTPPKTGIPPDPHELELLVDQARTAIRKRYQLDD
jgi:hypothetical protein